MWVLYISYPLRKLNCQKVPILKSKYSTNSKLVEFWSLRKKWLISLKCKIKCKQSDLYKSGFACVNLSMFRFVFRFVVFPLIREGHGMLPFPPGGLGGLLGPNPVHTMGIGQGTPWMSCQLITGPLLMASAHQEQLWGSVSCSRILRHVGRFRPGEPGFELVTFWLPDYHSPSSTHWATAAL